MTDFVTLKPLSQISPKLYFSGKSAEIGTFLLWSGKVWKNTVRTRSQDWGWGWDGILQQFVTRQKGDPMLKYENRKKGGCELADERTSFEG